MAPWNSSAKPAQAPHVIDFEDLRPTFTETEKSLLKTSWENIKVGGDKPKDQAAPRRRGGAAANIQTVSSTTLFCEQLYDNMLAEEPSLTLLFPSLQAQSARLAGVFGSAIMHADNLAGLDEFFVNLAKRHSRIIGVEAAHFELLGRALVRTLKDGLGDKCTPELEEAWIKLYSYLANVLLRAAADPHIEVVEAHNASMSSRHAASSGAAAASARVPSGQRPRPAAATAPGPPPSVAPPARPSAQTNGDGLSSASTNGTISSASVSTVPTSVSNSSIQTPRAPRELAPSPVPSTEHMRATSNQVRPENIRMKGRARRRGEGGKDCIVM